MLAEGKQSAGGDIGLDKHLHHQVGVGTGSAGAKDAFDLDAVNQFRVEVVFEVRECLLELQNEGKRSPKWEVKKV